MAKFAYLLRSLSRLAFFWRDRAEPRRAPLVCGNLDVRESWWIDSTRHREYAEERLRELEPVHALVRRWCGREASEKFDQVLALREEVDRLRDLVQETAWWLKNSGHPVKAGLLRRELGRIPEAGENARKSTGDPGG